MRVNCGVNPGTFPRILHDGISPHHAFYTCPTLYAIVNRVPSVTGSLHIHMLIFIILGLFFSSMYIFYLFPTQNDYHLTD